MFANSSSPSESLMAHSVQVGVSIASQKVAPRIANSMPPNRRWSFSEEVSNPYVRNVWIITCYLQGRGIQQNQISKLKGRTLVK